MNKLTTAMARAKFSEIVNLATYANETTIITRNGKDAAAVISVAMLNMLLQLEDKLDLKVARSSLKEAKKQGTISWRDLKSELKLEKK